MGMLAELVDYVIGVDTHRDTHSAAVVAAGSGAVDADVTIAANPIGYKRLLRFAGHHAPGRRVWAVESSGSFGAGLATFLLEHGEWVVEVDRPARPARRNGAKSDELDAIRAAHEPLRRHSCAHARDQPPQGARRHRARRAAPSTARPRHRRAGRVLRSAAHAALALHRASRHGDRAAPHRPARA